VDEPPRIVRLGSLLTTLAACDYDGGGKDPVIYELKCWPMYFEQIRIGVKTFDVRAALEAQAGDTLLLREWDPQRQTFTGRELYAQIAYQERSSDYPPAFGVPGAVVISALVVLAAQTPTIGDRMVTLRR
jgi:hypothetical protein